VLAERAAAGSLELILLDGVVGADWNWSQRDEAMARRILTASPPGARTLVVAGNAHTPTRPHRAGRPDGSSPGRAAAWDPGNPDPLRRREFLQRRAAAVPRYTGPEGLIRLHQDDGELLLDLAEAAEAVVLQRPRPWSGIFGPNGPCTSHGYGHKRQVPGFKLT